MSQSDPLAELYKLMPALMPKRRIFVSYHHRGDAAFYEFFSLLVHDHYEAVEDRSLERMIDSDNSDYVIQKIRDDYLTGTSCTVVLCGADTPGRKFVDWEIKSSLDKKNTLIGLCLPSNTTRVVPDRFLDNYNSGYALWLQWDALRHGGDYFKGVIEEARLRPAPLINNSRPLRRNNAPEEQGRRPQPGRRIAMPPALQGVPILPSRFPPALPQRPSSQLRHGFSDVLPWLPKGR